MKQVALSEIKDDLSRFLREAEAEEIVITRHGKPAGLLVGFASEDDWLDYRLEHDPRFLQRIESARASIRAGRGVRMEDLNAVMPGNEAPEADAPTRPGAAVAPGAPTKTPPPPAPPRSRRASRTPR